MTRTTVDELISGARKDALFEEAYSSPEARIRRALSETLFAIRNRANLSPAEIADRAGLQQELAARLERGDTQTVDALAGLEAFANAAETSIVLLFVDRQTSQERARVPLGGP